MSHLPPEWDDDDRMAVLFKALPAPGAARTARLNFWTTCVLTWTRREDKVTFTLQEAQQAFLRNSLVPQCLCEVITLMVREGRLAPLSSVTSQEGCGESWSMWGARLLAAPPRWAWAKLRTGASGGQLEQLVDVALLQERSNEVYDALWHTGSTAATDSAVAWDPRRTATLSSLYRALHHALPRLTVSGLELYLNCFIKHGKAVTLLKEGQTYVKVAPPGQAVGDQDISNVDIVEVFLQSAVRDIEERVGQLTKEAKQLQDKARGALKEGNRPAALSQLRRRRRVLSSLASQLAALDNASSTAHQLADARVNREVIAAFRSSALALKELMAGDKSADSAEDTMDQLQQVLDECSDVSEALSGPVTADPDADQLELELEQLLQADQVDQQTEEGADDLVAALNDLTIPSHLPSPSVVKEHDVSVASQV